MENESSILLPNGEFMPALGFGTWQATEEELEEALNIALEAGYRHIDAAPVYENEKIIGNVLKKWLDSGKIRRSDLFIVTKLPPTGNRPEAVEKWIKKSLKDLQLDYLDLYLVHTPFGFEEVGDDLHPVNENGEIRFDGSTDHVKVWAEMENQVKSGRTRAIGVSNFNIQQIQRLLNKNIVPISNLQIELHVYFQQTELVNFCKDNKISVTAHSPLGSRGLVKLLGKTEEIPDSLQNPVVLEIAKEYGKTAAQILLQHTLQKEIAVIPKSTNARRIKENHKISGWKLRPEDAKRLEKLDLGASGRVCDFGFFKGIRRHPEFPF